MFAVTARAQAPAGDYFMYIGTYTENTSKGIYAYRFQPSTGALACAWQIEDTTRTNPTPDAHAVFMFVLLPCTSGDVVKLISLAVRLSGNAGPTGFLSDAGREKPVFGEAGRTS